MPPGLTVFQLKLIAAGLMLLDHVQHYLPGYPVVQIPRQALGADFLLRIGRRLHPHAKRPLAWWRDCSPAH